MNTTFALDPNLLQSNGNASILKSATSYRFHAKANTASPPPPIMNNLLHGLRQSPPAKAKPTLPPMSYDPVALEVTQHETLGQECDSARSAGKDSTPSDRESIVLTAGNYRSGVSKGIVAVAALAALAATVLWLRPVPFGLNDWPRVTSSVRGVPALTDLSHTVAAPPDVVRTAPSHQADAVQAAPPKVEKPVPTPTKQPTRVTQQVPVTPAQTYAPSASSASYAPPSVPIAVAAGRPITQQPRVAHTNANASSVAEPFDPRSTRHSAVIPPPSPSVADADSTSAPLAVEPTVTLSRARSQDSDPDAPLFTRQSAKTTPAPDAAASPLIVK